MNDPQIIKHSVTEPIIPFTGNPNPPPDPLAPFRELIVNWSKWRNMMDEEPTGDVCIMAKKGMLDICTVDLVKCLNQAESIMSNEQTKENP